MRSPMIRLVRQADLFSILNALLGFLAIFSILNNNIRLAVSLILVAVLSDGLDGLIARKKGKGTLGEFLDPVADFLSFCVTPLILVLNIHYSGEFSLIESALFISIFSYLIFSLIRLTAFNSLKQRHSFIGLPTPAAGMIVTLVTYIGLTKLWIIPVMLILSILMILSISFPKTDNKIGIIAAILIFLTILLDKSYHEAAPLALLTALLIYVVLGPLYLKKKLRGSS